MAAFSAAGEYLPPMVVFQGQHVQSTWKPNVKDNGLFPWIYCNKSGWTVERSTSGSRSLRKQHGDTRR